MQPLKLTGYVDAVGGTSLSGWAADMNNPDHCVEVALYADGFLVATTRCLEARPDAVAAGYPGARAFSFELNPCSDPAPNKWEIAFAGTLHLLGNGVIHSTSMAKTTSNYWDDHWQQSKAVTDTIVSRWWQSERVVQRIQDYIGEGSPKRSAFGLHNLALSRFAGAVPFARGISVGCGLAQKEADAIACGLVAHFDLYELSTVAIESARRGAEAKGLAARMSFHLGDVFQAGIPEASYDVVYWNNSLHHMLDVRAAIAWSKHVLKPGGLFLMDDYVGATRMQWSDALLEVNRLMRESLPKQYLANPYAPGTFLSTTVARPDIDLLVAADPSECADSANILPALRENFPDAWVKLTGGGIYHAGLNDILHNIVSAKDDALLDQLVDLDLQCAQAGQTHYAVAMAVKP